MPLSRNQPSPERQSVLSFVSPSVADLLFYETVDAKTVGAGGGKTVIAISSATQAVEVTAGGTYDGDYHESGFLVQVTSTAHGYSVGDVVTVENAPDGSNGLNPNGTFEIRATDTNWFKYFVRGSGSTSTWGDAAVQAANTVVYKSHPQYGTAHPDTEKFPTHKLCHVKQADPNGLFFQYYYAAERNHQDDYNFEFSQADLGGNKYDTVVRTYVTLRSDFSDVDGEYQAGDPMPDPLNQFSADNAVLYNRDATSYGAVDEDETSVNYILMTRQQKRIGDQELDGLFVVEQRVYFRRVDFSRQSLDPATGGVLKTVEKLIYRGETTFVTADGGTSTAGSEDWEADANWGLTDAGQNIECQQLSHDWWKVTIQDVIPQVGTSAGVDSSRLIRQYFTYRNFTWPSVVGSLEFTSVGMKNGATKTSVTVRNKDGKDGFTGPTKMEIFQYWKKTPFSSTAVTIDFDPDNTGTISNPTSFRTSSANYAGVQFGVSVSNVLTEAITLTDFIGTSHPVYKMGEYAFPKPFCKASTPTDWPSSEFTASFDQKPFRGGFLLEVVKVYPPS